MKVVRESNENEVVLNFLTGELQSERFNTQLKNTLKDIKTTERIITKPNLNNQKENDLRKEILGKFRGYGKNVDLFENFPYIQSYNLCEFSSEDFKNIYYINYSYWNGLSNNTHSPIEAAKNIENNIEVYNVSNQPFIDGKNILEKNKTFLPMILLTHDYKSFVVLEGHSRITVYALNPQYFKNVKCFVLKCSKEDLDRWNN